MAKWRHYEGKSHSGRVQSSVAQDVEVQMTPLPKTSCVTFSKSVSLMCHKGRLRTVIGLPQDQACCLCNLQRQPSLTTRGTYRILSLQASLLALCTAKHTWTGSLRVFTMHLWTQAANEWRRGHIVLLLSFLGKWQFCWVRTTDV